MKNALKRVAADLEHAFSLFLWQPVHSLTAHRTAIRLQRVFYDQFPPTSFHAG
jgi:hypothetical protein